MLQESVLLPSGAQLITHKLFGYTVKRYWFSDCTLCSEGYIFTSRWPEQCETCEKRHTAWLIKHGKVRFLVRRKRHPLQVQVKTATGWKNFDKVLVADVRKGPLRLRVNYQAAGGTTYVELYEIDEQGTYVRMIDSHIERTLERAQEWIAEQCNGSLRDYWLR